MRSAGRGSGRRGFSLIELLVALVIFLVGLLGVAGLVVMAQRTLTRSDLILRGTLAAWRVGDSLATSEERGSGELSRGWGLVSWGPGEGGSVRIVATGRAPGDTLATLLVWPRPAGVLSLPGPDPLAPGAGG